MSIPQRMTAVQLHGHGDSNQLHYTETVPVPEISAQDVLIKVGASSVNNTDINTRTGWYSRSEAETGWSGVAMQFPRIQGADCCGRIVAVGDSVDSQRIGERVLVRTMQAPTRIDGHDVPVTLGSEIDGGFAQFVSVRSTEAFVIRSSLSDEELATFPCAYSTAEGLLQRAGVTNDRVLVTGASGGVGSAVVKLAAMRGATVVAIARTPHHNAIVELGATETIDRETDDLAKVASDSVDAVIDVVGGEQFSDMIRVLRPHGRYATAGAVAGPLVELDLRDLYLKDLTLLGCTFHSKSIFTDLIGYIESGELRPTVAATYPLDQIKQAQQRFLKKDFIGKISLVPPAIQD